jgi:hypothetical protein
MLEIDEELLKFENVIDLKYQMYRLLKFSLRKEYLNLKPRGSCLNESSLSLTKSGTI